MSVVVLTVEGISDHKFRKVLAVDVPPGEGKSSWEEILRGLIKRGLDPSKVAWVTSDDYLGLRATFQKFLPHAVWQRCQAHYWRNARDKVSRGLTVRLTISCVICSLL